jgi:hypothetical protein
VVDATGGEAAVLEAALGAIHRVADRAPCLARGLGVAGDPAG